MAHGTGTRLILRATLAYAMGCAVALAAESRAVVEPGALPPNAIGQELSNNDMATVRGGTTVPFSGVFVQIADKTFVDFEIGAPSSASVVVSMPGTEVTASASVTNVELVASFTHTMSFAWSIIASPVSVSSSSNTSYRSAGFLSP